MSREKRDVQILRWADIMRAWRLAGIVRDFSKAESLRAAAMLREKIEKGEVVRAGRGRYRVPF